MLHTDTHYCAERKRKKERKDPDNQIKNVETLSFIFFQSRLEGDAPPEYGWKMLDYYYTLRTKRTEH